MQHSALRCSRFSRRYMACSHAVMVGHSSSQTSACLPLSRHVGRQPSAGNIDIPVPTLFTPAIDTSPPNEARSPTLEMSRPLSPLGLTIPSITHEPNTVASTGFLGIVDRQTDTQAPNRRRGSDSPSSRSRPLPPLPEDPLNPDIQVLLKSGSSQPRTRGERKPAHFSIALNSSGSSALSSGLRRLGSSSSQSTSSTSGTSILRRLFRNKRSQTIPDTFSVNNASINNASFRNASSSDLSFSNGPTRRSEVDSISASLSPTSSIHTNFSEAATEILAIRTPAITEVHEDEEQQPRFNIASSAVASSGSMMSNTRAQHNSNADKDNTRSTTGDRPSPNHVATSRGMNSDSLLPSTPSSSNSSSHPGAPPAKPPSPNRTRSTPTKKSSNMVAPQPTRSATLSIDSPQSRNWEPVSPVVLGLMEMAASDSECLLRSATDGTVSAGNLEGLVFRAITDIEDPSRNDRFRATFLTIYQLFATSERIFDILKRRFESSELDPVAADSRYPWVNNALPSSEY
jgi:hypothetical protein